MLRLGRKSGNVLRSGGLEGHTGIVDEDVEVTWVVLELCVSFFDGLVIVEVDLDWFDSV